MMPKDLVETGAFKLSNLSLEECLVELEKYGNPRISKDKDGWHCSINVFVTGKGTEFKVRSNWEHKTHAGATNLCYTRLMVELNRIKET
jgi:hypothetical protein